MRFVIHVPSLACGGSEPWVDFAIRCFRLCFAGCDRPAGPAGRCGAGRPVERRDQFTESFRDPPSPGERLKTAVDDATDLQAHSVSPGVGSGFSGDHLRLYHHQDDRDCAHRHRAAALDWHVGRCAAHVDFSPLAGARVFLDTQFVTVVDKDWVISSIRRTMAEQGILLENNKDKAQVIVEAAIGAYGTDERDRKFGLPGLSLSPSLTTGAALSSAGSSTLADLLPDEPARRGGQGVAFCLRRQERPDGLGVGAALECTGSSGSLRVGLRPVPPELAARRRPVSRASRKCRLASSSSASGWIDDINAAPRIAEKVRRTSGFTTRVGRWPHGIGIVGGLRWRSRRLSLGLLQTR